MKTALLLVVSNVFMTLAWYGHLKFTDKPLWLVIVASWGVALFEYSFQVPANRIGARHFTVTQLKIMQECVTLAVFSVIAFLLFGERLRWNNAVAYAFILAAVFFAFRGRRGERGAEEMRQPERAGEAAPWQ
ncbi:MAG TPA: DMT family protein [Pyrinomonadaceae bacterium]|nr:DMT family protein [Pyrinomonadaceae bacterium]